MAGPRLIASLWRMVFSPLNEMHLDNLVGLNVALAALDLPASEAIDVCKPTEAQYFAFVLQEGRVQFVLRSPQAIGDFFIARMAPQASFLCSSKVSRIIGILLIISLTIGRWRIAKFESFIQVPWVYSSIQHDRRRVIALVKGGLKPVIAKLARSVSDQILIEHEANILFQCSTSALIVQPPDEVPKVVGYFRSAGLLLQRAVSQYRPSKEFSEIHLKFLLQLISPEETIDSLKILVHGDFAPWNMAINADGGLSVFDWEYASMRGGFGVDLVFYFAASEAYLGQMNLYRQCRYWHQRYCSAARAPNFAPEADSKFVRSLNECIAYLQSSRGIDARLKSVMEDWIEVESRTCREQERGQND